MSNQSNCKLLWKG